MMNTFLNIGLALSLFTSASAFAKMPVGFAPQSDFRCAPHSTSSYARHGLAGAARVVDRFGKANTDGVARCAMRAVWSYLDQSKKMKVERIQVTPSDSLFDILTPSDDSIFTSASTFNVPYSIEGTAKRADGSEFSIEGSVKINFETSYHTDGSVASSTCYVAATRYLDDEVCKTRREITVTIGDETPFVADGVFTP